jgi:hypothetical protein
MAGCILVECRASILCLNASRRGLSQSALASGELSRARVNAESKRVYLATFVPPLLPHDVSWPEHRLLITLLGCGRRGGDLLGCDPDDRGCSAIGCERPPFDAYSRGPRD